MVYFHIHQKAIRMKTLSLLFISILIISSQSCGDSSPSEEKEATEAFAELGKDEDFREAHEEPEAISPTINGKTISYTTSDGKDASAIYWKAAKPSSDYLFVIHEWWGLNDHIKEEAERLYNELEDVHVLALDLYDGGVATTREKASELMQGAEEARIEAIINGAINFAGKDARVATIGWCFGGGWSLKSSILAGAQGAACVIYYGMPVDDAEKLQPLVAPVLGIFAEKDQWINPQVANDFKAMATKAGKEVGVHIFEADHAFANPSSPRYVEEAAQQANALSLAFLKKHL